MFWDIHLHVTVEMLGHKLWLFLSESSPEHNIVMVNRYKAGEDQAFPGKALRKVSQHLYRPHSEGGMKPGKGGVGILAAGTTGSGLAIFPVDSWP